MIDTLWEKLDVHERIDYIINNNLLKNVSTLNKEEQMELIEIISDGYSVITIDWLDNGYIIDQKLSDSFYTNLGYSKADIRDYNLEKFQGISKKDYEDTKKKLIEAISFNSTTTGYASVIRKGGDMQKIIYRYSPVEQDNNNRVIKIIGIQLFLK